jgi:hypothetical protein
MEEALRTISGNILLVGSVFATTLFAGQVAQASEYVPPTGEQPVYGQRYTPGLSEAKTVFEINAARLVNKEIGLEFEMRSSENMNLGADIVYTTKSDESGNSKGESQGIFLAPKLRLYPMQSLNGIFVGGKLFLGQVTTTITVDSIKSEKASFVAAPAVHVGYRLLTQFGFTWSAYAGAGLNIPKPKFETSDLSEKSQENAAADIISKMNNLNKDVRVDVGVTLGIAL